jgi:RNase H-fold protein (predicted Holliday junction resolvase)
MNSPILALDIGLRRTGVALSESGFLAQPLGVIEWQPPHTHALVEGIIEHLRRYEVKTLVIGVPLSEGDEVTEQAARTMAIITQIEEAITREKLEVAVVPLNEYGSTVDGKTYFPDADRDSAAAALILQEYLEQQGVAW